jgi:hypothetical protein
MNHRKKPPQHLTKNRTYCKAFERLDVALAKNTPSNDIAKIDMMRRILFGVAVEDELPGAVVIPE